MRKLLYAVIVVFAFLALISPLSPGGDAAAAVWISELIADPATDWNADGIYDAQGDEWIEVVNDGASAVDLSNYYVCDAYGDQAQLRLSGQIGPGEARVFFGSDAVAWQVANDISITGLSLNNSGDTVRLFVGDPSSQFCQMIDALIYTTHTVTDDRSCGKLTCGGELILFDGLNPYSGSLVPSGSGCEPSPGELNYCDVSLPAEPASWGAVKSFYSR